LILEKKKLKERKKEKEGRKEKLSQDYKGERNRGTKARGKISRL